MRAAQSMKQYDRRESYPERSQSMKQYDRIEQNSAQYVNELRAAQSRKQCVEHTPAPYLNELRAAQSMKQYERMDNSPGARAQYDQDPTQYYAPILHVRQSPPRPPPPRHAQPLYQPYDDPTPYNAPPRQPMPQPVLHTQYDPSYYGNSGYAPPPVSHSHHPAPPPPRRNNLYQPAHPAHPAHPHANPAEYVDVDYNTEYDHYYAQNQGQYEYV